MTTPLAEIPEVRGYAYRTNDFTWSAWGVDPDDPDGDPIPVVFGSGDKVRFKLAITEGGTPIIDLVSGTPSVNYSAVAITTFGVADTTPAGGTVRLAQADVQSLS